MKVFLPFAIALAAGVLSGCATLVRDDWHAEPEHVPLPARHIEIPEADLPRICGNYPGMRLHGCAVRVVEAKVCLIYTGPRPASWLMDHERMHCAGWDHGPLTDSTDRRVAAVSTGSP